MNFRCVRVVKILQIHVYVQLVVFIQMENVNQNYVNILFKKRNVKTLKIVIGVLKINYVENFVDF